MKCKRINTIKKVLLLILFAVSLFSCSENIADDETGTIAGTIKASADSKESNLEGIMAVLIDAGFKTDTIDHKNEAAFIDTVYTNTKGEFIFNNLASGNYYIYLSKPEYKFTGNTVSIDDVIRITGDNHRELDYTADRLLNAGITQVTTFMMSYPANTKVKYKIFRLKWVFFVSYWDEIQSETFTFPEEREYLQDVFDVEMAYTYGVSSLTNAFKFKYTITDKSGDEITKTFYASTDLIHTYRELMFWFDWEGQI